MITGFNTDIEHEGVVYHVQTEDKGVSTPLILSLVYNRGTILASKRSPYDDLLVPAFDEKALSERLQKQHKLICAAIRAGRIEDLKRIGKDTSATKSKNSVAEKATIEPVAEKAAEKAAEKKGFLSTEKIIEPTVSEVRPENRSVPAPQPPTVRLPLVVREEFRVDNPKREIELSLPKRTTPEFVAETKTAQPAQMPVVEFPVTIVEEEMIVDAVEIVEEETILAAEAVEIISDFADDDFQIADRALKIMLPDNLTFRSGERKTIGISVYRGAIKNRLAGAHVMIKVFGAAFRPLIFHAKTDAGGTATVHLQMPQVKGGRAAVLIRAMSDGEETELRRPIEQS